MDLGATICTSRDPKCLLCPLSNSCEGLDTGEPGRFPVKPAKKPKPERRGQAYWIERAGSVWLVTRSAKGMLGGMRALPDDGWSAQTDGSGTAPLSGDWENLGAVKHIFTHASLTLEVLRIESCEPPAVEGDWWPIEQIEQAGLPTLFAKAMQLVQAQRG